jgi:hypothetical protein
LADEDKVIATEAMGPSPIAFALMPERTQVYAVAPPAHETDFPAASADDPAVT